jgi:predicted aspartyl protease
MRTEVPFQLAGGDNPLILIPAHANGQGPLAFVLDTGASVCLLTPERARALGLASGEAREGHGAAGRVRVEMSELESLVVGEMRRAAIRVAVTADLDRIGAAIGARVDGVVGFSFFKDCRIEIDYRSLRLAFDSDAQAEVSLETGAASVIPFTLAAPSKPLAVVSTLVNGRGPYAFAVDTGASATVVSEAAPDRQDQQHAERQRQHDDDREELPGGGIRDDVQAAADGDRQQQKIQDVLVLVGDRPRRQHFLQLAGGHQAAGEGQRS